MFIWLLFSLTIILEQNLLLEANLSQFLSAYDVVKCHILKSRIKRDFLFEDDNQEHKVDQFDLEIMFVSRGRMFHLLLYEEVPFSKSILLNASKDLQTNCRFYEGIVKNEPTSSVIGYVHNESFSGSIKTLEKIYFVQSAPPVLNTTSGSQMSIVYSNYDIKFPEGMNLMCNDPSKHLLNKSADNVEHLYKSKKQVKNIRNGLSCLVEMVADHTLYHYLGKDRDKVHAFLYMHGKFADSIFRRTDFDGDGQADNLRIMLGPSHVYTSEKDSNYPMAHDNDISNFLTSYSQRLQRYCVSLCMTFRPFEGKIIGEAYRPGPHGPPGGICDNYVIDQTDYTVHSYNTAVVNIRKMHTAFPLGISLFAVAHELGHSFGSDHDPTEISVCSPGGNSGNYIMYPSASKLKKPLGNKFSPCSRKQMMQVLYHKGHCLESRKSVCGNAIRESGEECDCGEGQEMCDLIDPCCTSSNAKLPEIGCTIRSSKGYVCSPKEEPCCAALCEVTNDLRLCLFNENQCFPSKCDGKQATCPMPKNPNNKKMCKDLKNFCRYGLCNDTICQHNGYLDCLCQDSPSNECLKCCLVEDICIPASELGLIHVDGTAFALPAGTPCYSGKFNCNDFGVCLIPKSHSYLLERRILYWFITFFSLVVIAFIGVLIYASHQTRKFDSNIQIVAQTRL